MALRLHGMKENVQVTSRCDILGKDAEWNVCKEKSVSSFQTLRTHLGHSLILGSIRFGF